MKPCFPIFSYGEKNIVLPNNPHKYATVYLLTHLYILCFMLDGLGSRFHFILSLKLIVSIKLYRLLRSASNCGRSVCCIFEFICIFVIRIELLSTVIFYRTDTEVNIVVTHDGDIVSIAKNDTELQETTDIPKYSRGRDDCENANNQRSARKAKSRRGRKPSKKVIENLEAVALENNESILNEISVEKNKRSKVSKNRSLIKVEEEMKSESNHDLFNIKTESNPFGYECSQCKNIYETHSTFSNHKCEPTQNSDGMKLEDSQESSNSKKVHESVGKKKYQKQASVVCHLCGMSLKTGSMRSHIESKHEKRQSYKCTECEMAFHTDTSRYKHFMKVHKTRVNGDGQEYLCETCGKDFNDSISLYHHVYGHKHKKSVKKTDVSTGMPVIHKCCYCNKTFEQKSSMIRHVRMHQEHNKDLPYVCQECGKRFVFKSLFVKHQTVHKPDRPFDCSICKKKFKTKNCVDNHMRITHSGERKFRCSLCGDCFKQNHHLAQHMVHHSDERPFGCLICDKSYKVKHDLKLHCKRVHQTDLFPSLYFSGSRIPDQNEKLKSESNETFKSEQNVEPGYELSLVFCNKILE